MGNSYSFGSFLIRLMVLSILMFTAVPQGRAADLSPDEIRQIAAEAYVYVYPLVLMDITRRISTNVDAGAKPGFGPMNAFTPMRTLFPPVCVSQPTGHPREKAQSGPGRTGRGSGVGEV